VGDDGLHDQEAAGFGPQLRHLRLRAGLTREVLAERAGLSVPTLAALERGERRRPHPQTVVALARALGLTPEEQTHLYELAESLAALGTERSPATAPSPVKARRAALVQLPVPPSELIGRDKEVAAAAALLQPAQSIVRLLTLTGPGGVGKTRLALAVADLLVEAYTDAVVFVDLSLLRDQRLVPAAIADALELRGASGRSARQPLFSYLEQRQVLLVLDNFEQLLGAVPLVAELVASCPRLALLVTSRSALRIRAEHRLVVPPLATPTDDTSSPQALEATASVDLFMRCARAVAPGFTLTAENARSIAQICRRLDGIPLAIELAAARIGLLSPEALRRRLEHRLPLLTGGAVDGPERHQTLSQTLAWSHDLLGPAEQRLFRGLAVFAGGWTLEAAEGVCTDADASADDVLERLDVLVNTSLVQRWAGADQEPRFGMLETVREYAEIQLANSQETAVLRTRHRDWYVGFAERTEALSDALAIERENLRAALDWSLGDEGGAEAGLRLAGALWWFWFAWGHLAEGRQWLEAMLARPPATDRAGQALRARALLSAGHLARFAGDLPSARSYFEQSLALFEAGDDRSAVGYPLFGLGVLAQLEGKYPRARTLAEQSLARFRESGNVSGARDVTWHLGLVARLDGDYVRARDVYEANLKVCRSTGDTRGVAQALVQLGVLVLRIEGDRARAIQLCSESLSISREIANKPGMAYALARLGNIALSASDHARARALLQESLDCFREIMDRRQLAICLAFCGNLGVRGGLPFHGARLHGAAAALDPLYQTSLDPMERAECDTSLTSARVSLGHEDFADAWATGAAMPLAQARALTAESL
jgi:predicted ATPase/DNA-binding XRE family transcriptional regulator